TVKKVYLALVKGRLSPEKGIIEAPIGRDTIDRTKMAISTVNQGRNARTQYKVLRYLGDHTLLEAMPETGRTHQIRVHLAAIGHAVEGDAVYGKKSPIVARQFLHAHKISFHLPGSGKWVEFVSPLPGDLAQALKCLT
ncbi:MAG: RluA family pseudouridine synthase, partial [Dehalococcoidales bacterium]|nr:RluA family pseudouridine synthase [Dehalococcoidales bacterium]